MIVLRQEKPSDFIEIRNVTIDAFENMEFSDHQEHELVEKIRQSSAYIPELSIVAQEDKKIVGHIMYSKIRIVNEVKSIPSLALAPVSVIPSHQKKGIGKRLIEQSLVIAKALGYESVIVLGHEHYYPKFGFKPAAAWNIYAPFDVPENVFMALELKEGALEDVSGVVQYSEAFR
ncbi:MAG: GNAT family N-acetyltransferase [Bacillaceae bacterium]